MNRSNPTRSNVRGQRGYALLIVLFLLALLAISVSSVATNVLTDARREKETEMIWRGKQYVRGIRLYYTKTHKYPTELEDLYKAKTGLRFMRQAYKDPMNPADGSWRMIYVGPNGQLIGSWKSRTTNAIGQAAPGFGSAAGGAPSGTGSSNGFGSASSFGASNNSGFGPSSNNPAVASASQQSPAAVNGQSGNTDDSANSLDPATLQAAANLSDGAIIGGNIIGVGSKINKKSLIYYDRARNYLQFEFVWDASATASAGAGVGQTVQSNNPSAVPTGSNPGDWVNYNLPGPGPAPPLPPLPAPPTQK